MYKISAELAAALTGKEFVKGNKFNPIQDKDGDWFISEKEVIGNTNLKYSEDLKGLKKSEFIPSVYDIF